MRSQKNSETSETKRASPSIANPTHARYFAELVHKGQQYNGLPFTHHLDAVANKARELGGSPEVIAAAYLHDSVEDTTTTLADLRLTFGDEIADLVDAVTDGVEGNRAARKARVWPLLRANDDAAHLKVADRLANMEYSLQQALSSDPDEAKRGRGFLKMYEKEHKSFIEEFAPVFVRQPDLA